MGQKMSLSKTTAAGEQLTFVLAQCNENTGESVMTDIEFMDAANNVMTFSDLRMQEMNIRHLEAYQLDKYFEPAIWYRVRAILGVIGGQQTIQQLAQRWDAEVEETRAMEQGRLEALARSNGSEVYEFNSEYYAVDGPRDAPLTVDSNGDIICNQTLEEADSRIQHISMPTPMTG